MEKVTKIILINDKKEFLFQLRDNNSKIVYPGGWSLFGGGIKNGEEILMGLEREINEEIPDCLVEDIKFVGKGYVEIKDLNLANYWINEENKSGNFNNFVKEVHVFKGRINEKIDLINKKITEGQKAGYFKLDQFESIGLDNFVKSFIYQNKYKIFS